jgi:hypothetical protein
MSDNTVLKASAEAILDKTRTITVDVKPQTWFERLAMRMGWMAKQRKFDVKPLCLGSVMRISKLFLDIEDDALKNNLLNGTYTLINGATPHVIQAVAIGICNSRKEPSKKLLRFIENNFTQEELLCLFQVVYQQMDIQSFLRSIILIKGTNVLQMQMSPTDQGRDIASGEPLEE